MKQEKNIRYLLERYLHREATAEEYTRFLNALEEIEPEKWQLIIQSSIEEQNAEPNYDFDRWEHIIHQILDKEKDISSFSNDALDEDEEKTIGRFAWRRGARVAVAATLILLLGLGLWFGLERHAQESGDPSKNLVQSNQTIHPGGNKAILTLSSGKKILLNNIQNGVLSTQGNTQVIKLNRGLLSYNDQQPTANSQRPTANSQQPRANIQYNAITTPAGGQYKVILPDGSKVWLNAASSIRFPVSFSEEKRQVAIKGEVYFEIAKNESKPFLVSVKDMQVKVLGTHFNVMAYENEPAMQTTLLEGKVKVVVGSGSTSSRLRSMTAITNPKQYAILKPGQEARIADGAKEIKVTQANTEEAIAWKNGLFQFSNTDIETIMRSIARWYNVDVVYADGVPSGNITGKIPRNTNLSSVLEIMRLSGVHFEIKGRKVIVLNS